MARLKRSFKRVFTSPPYRRAFDRLVWDIVARVPKGKVITYGQIGSLIPKPGGVGARYYRAAKARWVGNAMAACPSGLPWHRVINAQGKISVRSKGDHHHRQRLLLEAEGVTFDQRGRMDLSRFGWSMAKVRHPLTRRSG